MYRWLVHADNLFSEGLHVMGWTECTKLFLDLRRFVGAIWPYRECLLSVVCFSLSLWEMVAVLLLIIVGGAIPASWYCGWDGETAWDGEIRDESELGILEEAHMW